MTTRIRRPLEGLTQAGDPENQDDWFAAMPLVLKTKHERFAFRFGARAAFRSTSELVDQLQDQPQTGRAQHRFALAQKHKELSRCAPRVRRTAR